MKKGRIIAAALAAVMLVTGVTGVKAAPESKTTNVGIGFTSDETQPGNDNGALAISWFPTDLDFGNSHTASTASQTFTLATSAKERWIEVKDERIGAQLPSTEWILKGELSELIPDGDTSKKLTGVVLKMDTETLYDNSNNLSQPTRTVVYAGQAVAADTSFNFVPGTAQELIRQENPVTADERVAMVFKNIQLVVGGAQLDGKQYTGTVTWTLNDTI